MKYILTLIIFSYGVVFGQNNDTLYLNALEIYTTQIDSFYSLNSTTNNYKIYLEENAFFNNIPNNVGKYEIIVISNKNLTKIYKENKGELMHTKISPIRIHEDLLQIDIIPYEGTLIKNNLNLGLNSWTKIFFRYDCEKRRWLFYKVENQGI